jgi:VanZ family protein
VPVVAHVLAFAILAATLEWGRERSGWGVRPGFVLGIAVLYGALDEWHQSFVPGRHATAADWGADLVGVALGYLVFRGLRRRPLPGDETAT